MTPRPVSVRPLVALGFAVAMALTALVTGLVHQNNRQHLQHALVDATERAADAVTKRIELYQYGLRGARGAVLASGENGISRERFLSYSKTRDVTQEFPGARGFGFIRRVPAQQQDDFLARARADGMPDFQIRQLSPHDGERFVIQYIEPVENNRQAVGLDIASESSRRSAAMAAMASGEVRITGPITLVQATGNPLQSFLILLPIYRGSLTPDTVEARMAKGIGWSYAPLLTEEVLQGLKLDREGLHLLLSDITDSEQPLTFFDQHELLQPSEEVASHALSRQVYGRLWQIELHATPAFAKQLNLFPTQLAASIGTLLSLLLATLLGVTLVSRQRHRQILVEQARSAAIVESSSDGIIGQSLDGTVLSWNHGAERIFGYSAAETVGRKLFDLTIPDHLAGEERNALQRIAAHQPVDNFDTLGRCKDGHRVDVSVSISPLLDDTGALIGLSKTVRDISAQKAAEARILELNVSLEQQVSERTRELRELNVLLNTVLQSASEVSIIATDLDGVIRVFNHGAERLLGYEAEEIIGVETPAIFHLAEEVQARSQELSQEYGQAITGFRVFVHKPELGEAESREWSYIRKDGVRFTVKLLVTAMRDASASVVGYLGIALDLSQEIRLRRDALVAHDQMALAAKVAELGIWSWTPADNRLQWNERMFELYGYPLELGEQGLNYQHWRQRLHPEDLAATETNLQDVLASKATFDRVFRIARPDGQMLYIQPGAHVERDELGNPVKITGINRDITAQLQLEAGLRHAKEQADAASAAKSAFLANMSHEIRTPMNAVLGMLQLVQATELNARQLDYVLKAQGAAHALLGLLNDILDYSKIEAGKLQLDIHDFELEPMLRDLAVVLAGNQGGKDIEVMFDVDTALPSVLHGDSLRLQQVLINLAGNALKFTHSGQVVVSLQQLQRGTEHVRLRVAVSDTGIGISEHQLQRIFDGFTQAEAATTRRYGGTGLGLVICKRLVELMGGSLHVESLLGTGSRFWFDIELGASSGSDLLVPPQSESEHLRVLIVDDNLVARQLLQQTILDLGWQANTADSGKDALARIQQAEEPYDIVLMDWRMPGMDGLEVAHHMREADLGHRPPPTVIMITAHGREILADRYSEENPPFAGFLTKPITPRQLVTSILQARHGESSEPPVPGYKLGQRLLGLHLLVVEDNALNRQVARELLTGEGAEVSLAEDGLQGVQMALHARPPFDAILMDVQMPDIDGLEATRRIRQQAQHQVQPIIAMTANASHADRDLCLAAGMNDHVGKPIDIEKLVAVIRQWCGLGAPHEQAQQEDETLEEQASILKRFGGNLTLLRSILELLPDDLQQQIEQLQVHLRNRDTTAVLKSLHTLKGSSGTLGARQVAARIAELEEQATQDATPLLDDSAWLNTLRQQLSESCERLRASFSFAEAPIQTIAPAHAAQKWMQTLQALDVQLQQGNLDALESLQNLAMQIPNRLRSKVEEIRQKVNARDFESARQLLHALQNAVQDE